MILNTQQIILLCLLVSFVTSIATGIIVVSLMQQAPEPVTATINRVIERTVEIAQQPVEEVKSIITSTQPQKEVVTVVVNQEEQSINAVAKNEKSIARLVSNNSSENFVALGIVINESGDIVADKRSVDRRGIYLALYGNGKKLQVKAVPESETADFITFRINEENPGGFTTATFADSDSLKLAQSVISLSGSKQTSVSTGEITSLNKSGETLTSISTSVNAQNVLAGSVLLNLSGSIVGIKVSGSDDRATFMPAQSFKTQIAAP